MSIGKLFKKRTYCKNNHYFLWKMSISHEFWWNESIFSRLITFAMVWKEIIREQHWILNSQNMWNGSIAKFDCVEGSDFGWSAAEKAALCRWDASWRPYLYLQWSTLRAQGFLRVPWQAVPLQVPQCPLCSLLKSCCFHWVSVHKMGI